MPANTSPIFTLVPNTSRVSLGTTPNTASDGSGTLITAFTAGANGSRVDSISIKNAQVTPAASSANVIRIFVTDTSGANPTLLTEEPLPAATRSASVVGASLVISYSNGLLLASGQLIKICQHVYAGAQDLTHAVVRGGDF